MLGASTQLQSHAVQSGVRPPPYIPPSQSAQQSFAQTLGQQGAPFDPNPFPGILSYTRPWASNPNLTGHQMNLDQGGLFNQHAGHVSIPFQLQGLGVGQHGVRDRVPTGASGGVQLQDALSHFQTERGLAWETRCSTSSFRMLSGLDN